MKRFFLFLLLIVVACFSFACKKQELSNKSKLPVDNPSFVIKDRLVLGLDDSFPPMGFRDENNKIVGFDIDLAREVAKRLNIDLVLQPIDWASKELELNNGNIDCIWNGLSVDSARQESMLLSKPYLANKMIIVVKAGSVIEYKAGLKGKKIGVQAGSTAVKSLSNDSISKEVDEVVQFENNVLALADLKIGRIDAVVIDEVVARYLVGKDKANYHILDDDLGSEVYAIAFKKGNVELSNKVATALKSMAEDGATAEISKKWFGDDVFLK